jgi:hypothetical protein
MKKAILFLLSAFLFISACASKNISVDLMNSLVTFNKSESDKLPITCILILPGDITKMPLYEEDKDIWPWFFTEGFSSVCEHVTVVGHFDEIQPPPRISLIFKPKLIGWTLLEVPQKFQDQILWHCRLKVEFYSYDAHNVITQTFIIEKEGWRRDRAEAVSDAMDRFVPSLRRQMEDSSLFFFPR